MSKAYLSMDHLRELLGKHREELVRVQQLDNQSAFSMKRFRDHGARLSTSPTSKVSENLWVTMNPFSQQSCAFPIPHLATLRNKEYGIFLNGENRSVLRNPFTATRLRRISDAEIRRSLERAHSANGDVTNRYADDFRSLLRILRQQRHNSSRRTTNKYKKEFRSV
ncbi:hypothetical protein TNCT_614261 [Trichonephila clavata]|uniref:Uncharacterized protein n=1 Tax=Trichonephila clavata TaxID=2740835 RepID=A0A8X6KRZ6_TRICU|nr:hypothetical protein TNCT_614261 [Trichonephila clavata]